MTIKFCSECDNPADEEFLCSHCDEPVCLDCAEEFIDNEGEDEYGIEEREVLFTVCRSCRE